MCSVLLPVRTQEPSILLRDRAQAGGDDPRQERPRAGDGVGGGPGRPGVLAALRPAARRGGRDGPERQLVDELLAGRALRRGDPEHGHAGRRQGQPPQEAYVSKCSAARCPASQRPLLDLLCSSLPVSHRRSLSEDVGLMVSFPPHTSPSEKARCHFMSPQSAASSAAGAGQPCAGQPCAGQPGAGGQSSGASGGTRLTAKHVGESMCREDPHYLPSEKGALNPFAALSQFRGVKKILGDKGEPSASLSANLACSGDLFSSCFELPSPFYCPTPPSSPFTECPALLRGSPALQLSQESLTSSRLQDVKKCPRKLSLGPPFTVPISDLLGTTRQSTSQECVSPLINTGVDMWCKVGSRWRLKSEVEAELSSGKRPNSECKSSASTETCQNRSEDGLKQGSIFSPHKASDDYLKMDSEVNDDHKVNDTSRKCEKVSTSMSGKVQSENKAEYCQGFSGSSSLENSQTRPYVNTCQVSSSLQVSSHIEAHSSSEQCSTDVLSNIQKKSWCPNHPQYLSLPSSPTFVRRRPVLASTAINPKVLTQRLLETQNKSRASSLPKSSADDDSVFSGHSSVMDCKPDEKQLLGSSLPVAPLPLQRRLSSSSSNLNTLLLSEDDSVAGTVLGGFPSVALRRRGSCESGFYSSVGEDYGLPGIFYVLLFFLVSLVCTLLQII